jgi:hypothetical protein
MSEGWLTGWKAISKYVGKHERTCKRYRKRYSLPIKKDPGGRPIAIPYELDEWLINFNRIKNSLS